jgi:hypothetical protein
MQGARLSAAWLEWLAPRSASRALSLPERGAVPNLVTNRKGCALFRRRRAAEQNVPGPRCRR